MVTHLLVKKSYIGPAIFTLISINGQYCAMSQNLEFWPPFLNIIIFFFKFYLKNVNVFMFLNFEPNFIENILGKVVFQILVTWYDLFCETKNLFYGCHFKTKLFLIVLFADIWLFSVYTHYGASFVPKFLRKSPQKWMGPSGPPCAQMGVISSLIN